MNEARRIFRANGISGDPEDVYNAVDGLDKKLAGIVLKSDRGTMHTGNVHLYEKNKHLFALEDPISGARETIQYDKVAEVWW
jgi:hypothetical protein